VDAVDEVMAIFRRMGFGEASVIGKLAEGPPRLSVT
jgi:hypothetical protein